MSNWEVIPQHFLITIDRELCLNAMAFDNYESMNEYIAENYDDIGSCYMSVTGNITGGKLITVNEDNIK